MAKIGNIRFNFNSFPEGTEAKVYGSRVKALILARELTIPGSRGFGLPQDYVDMSPMDAVNELALELAEKMPTYIPEAEASSVTGNANLSGELDVTIFIERSDEEVD